MWINLDAYCTPDEIMPGFDLTGDITITGHPEYADGVYRRLDPVFLGWIRDRVLTAEKRRANPEQVLVARLFYEHLVEVSGLTPTAPHPGYLGPRRFSVPDWD